METTATINQETINRLHDKGNATSLNLACNTEACYVAISEYELVYFENQARAASSTEPVLLPAARF